MSLFVSYRRDDTVAESGAIFRLLKERIDNPSVVTDTSSISTGAERSSELRRAMEDADLVLVVIGPEWICGFDGWSRHGIDQEGAWVRQEARMALDLDVPIITNP